MKPTRKTEPGRAQFVTASATKFGKIVPKSKRAKAEAARKKDEARKVAALKAAATRERNARAAEEARKAKAGKKNSVPDVLNGLLK
jgi:hypothetical protein